ncbi:MAG TPA: DUF3857 and transglutaminase domain-containing protein [Thermoanaerobaculia bacterium]|nr:DUF3857 and transglutaminase domain-containing protein [Thermoanaerobaculia bacterium]
MLRQFALLALVCLAPAVLFAADEFRAATPEELAMKDASWSPGAAAVVLDWNVRHDDQDSRAIEYVRIKVLTEEGKKYGDIELFSIPQFHQVRGIKARTIAPNGAAAEFNGKIYDKIIVKRGGLRMMQKTFTLPNVVPGTIIEYRYVVEWPTSQLRTNRWALQREIPIQHASFWVRPWREGISSVCTTKGLPPDQAPRRVKDRFEFEIDKVVAFESEPYSPPEGELKPRLEFFYTQGNAEEYWSETARSASTWVDDYIGNRGGIRKAAAEITAGAATPEEKLRRLYARAQQIRNLSYEPDKTAQEEKREKLRDNDDIEDVLRNGYGYSRQINRLFAGLARAAGFDAQIVLVSSRREMHFSKQIPDLEQLSGDVVVVNVDGQERYFDPGTPYLPFGMLPWENTAVAGLRLRPKKTWEWVMTPDQPVTSAQTARTADLRLVDDVVKGTATITYRGQDALARRISAMNEDEAANRKSFEEAMKEMFPDGSTVKLTKIEHLTGAEEPLTATFEVELPNLGTLAGSRALVPISVFEATAKNPFAGAQRKYPIYFSYQREIEDKVTLHLPEGYAVESVPKPVKLDVGALAYTAQHANDGKAITLTRKMTVRTIAIESKHYEVLKKFYGARVTADHDAVVLKKAAS